MDHGFLGGRGNASRFDMKSPANELGELTGPQGDYEGSVSTLPVKATRHWQPARKHKRSQFISSIREHKTPTAENRRSRWRQLSKPHLVQRLPNLRPTCIIGYRLPLTNRRTPSAPAQFPATVSPRHSPRPNGQKPARTPVPSLYSATTGPTNCLCRPEVRPHRLDFPRERSNQVVYPRPQRLFETPDL